jgi:hypothetical protein
MEYYFKPDAILLKTAPLLDISAGILELQNVKTIHIVALENDVKAMGLHKDYAGPIEIKTINLLKTKQKLLISTGIIKHTLQTTACKQYEPNSAIMKSGGFDEVAQFFTLNKLQNILIYTLRPL